MKRICAFAATALCGLLLATPAMATKAGFYLGGSVGGASTDFNEGNVKFDDDDAAWKVFAGYHFLQFFAVEAAYRDLGTVSQANYNVDTTGYDVAGLAGLPLGPVYLFGKLGVVYWDTDASTGPSYDGTGYEAGIGASVDVFKVQLRGEVEYLDVLDGSVMYSVGAAWRF